jgi:hypothetical protein
VIKFEASPIYGPFNASLKNFSYISFERKQNGNPRPYFSSPTFHFNPLHIKESEGETRDHNNKIVMEKITEILKVSS